MKTTAAEILNRRFGVEVEMTNISRPHAARVCRETLAAAHPDRRYSIVRVPSYDTRRVTELYPNGKFRHWDFMSDSSVHVRGEGMAEFVTPLLDWSDMEDLQALIRAFREAGALSNPAYECGVHIHVDAADLDAAQLKNLANLCASHEELLMEATNLDPSRRTWCAPIHPRFLAEINRRKIRDLEDMKLTWYEMNTGVRADRSHEHYENSRYHVLNLHSLWQGKGVEFRLWQFNRFDPTAPVGRRRGGLHAGRLKAYVQMCLALVNYANKARNCSPKVLHNGNKKYAMRCWLLRLGFIGPEFKTARGVFTEKLEGNSSRVGGRPSQAN